MPFILSVKDTEGFEVEIKPGGKAEHDLVQGIVQRIRTQAVDWLKSDAVVERLKEVGVGVFKSEARVLDSVKTALREQGMQDLEDRMLEAIEQAVKQTLYALKSDVKPV